MKAKSTRIHSLSITKARVNLGQVARRAHVNNEYFILEKDGYPVAGIMNADELEDYLELRNPRVREQIRQSREEFLARKGRSIQEFLAGRAVRKAAQPGDAPGRDAAAVRRPYQPTV